MIINKWKIVITMIIGMLLSVTSAYAVDVNITVNGSVIARPCTVGTKTANVDLGDLYTYNFIQPNSASPWYAISLDLVDCPIGTSVVAATFKGVTDNTGYYKNLGTSEKIQLQLQDIQGNNLNSGAIKKIAVNDSTLSTSFPLRVRALSVSGRPTQGSVQAIIDVTYTYL
ncbi:fimbrial protein [Proteus myxofaciens]|uniref:FimG family fimbrial adaptor subunit n=1 Tax=Proteus myxofaciens ATCC 19692 TaxID=1354337 RepID=A0A198GIS7_9GAMM|nr:fimbrial protein [Proteus myxofaciens]OAT36724.1 FimG family fimbrial adaptor subunit [Proteus myxofaciens ATCC 19692]